MKAVLQSSYGPPRQLRTGDVPRPVAGPGEVLLQVHAASVHADVWHMVRGVPYVLRLMGAGVRRPRNPIPGTDAAGVVAEVGPGATRYAPGDAVFGEVIAGMQWRNGGAYAEYVAVPEGRLEPKPATLTYEEAAALPTAGLIALMAVRPECRVSGGDRVLVNGAAGAVGMLAVQIAKADGAHVTAVDAGDRHDLLASIGADEVLDYRRDDFTAGPVRYDAIIDIPGNHPYSRVKRVLTDRGRYAWIGHDAYGSRGRRWLGSLPLGMRFMAGSMRDPHLPRPSEAAPGEDGMRVLAELAAAGRLRPVVEQTYPLDEAATALEHLESGTARGRLVLVTSAGAG